MSRSAGGGHRDVKSQSGADQNHRGRETGESGARIRGCHFMASCWKAAVGWKLTKHEPQILRAGDFILDPGGVPLLAKPA